MMIKKIILATAGFLMLSQGGCLKPTQENARQKAPTGSAGSNSLSPDYAKFSCLETEKTSSSKTTWLGSYLDGKAESLKDKNQKNKSLCSYFSESNDEVLVFQFVGLLCLSCQDEAPKLSQAISSSISKKSKFFLVFPEKEAESKESEIIAWQQKYAPAAVGFLFDNDRQLWGSLTGNKFTFGTTLGLSKSGMALVANDGTQLDSFISNLPSLETAAAN